MEDAEFADPPSEKRSDVLRGSYLPSCNLESLPIGVLVATRVQKLGNFLVDTQTKPLKKTF